MRIAVCIKQILDPEISSSDFQVDFTAKKAAEGQGDRVINPYDLNAIEVALQLKDSQKDVMITTLTLGGESSIKALRHALAMGCDEAILLKDSWFEGLDSSGIAMVLAKGIKKAGNFDLVLCGRQAGDWDMRQVGSLIAEALSFTCIARVYNVKIQKDKLHMKREIDKGYEILEAAIPALATITGDSSNQPRFASMRGIKAASRKNITVWSAQDLEINEEIQRFVIVDELVIPSYERQITLIDGEDGAEKGAKLARHLLELNLI